MLHLFNDNKGESEHSQARSVCVAKDGSEQISLATVPLQLQAADAASATKHLPVSTPIFRMLRRLPSSATTNFTGRPPPRSTSSDIPKVSFKNTPPVIDLAGDLEEQALREQLDAIPIYEPEDLEGAMAESVSDDEELLEETAAAGGAEEAEPAPESCHDLRNVCARRSRSGGSWSKRIVFQREFQTRSLTFRVSLENHLSGQLP